MAKFRTAEQKEALYAEIEDKLFLEGLHRSDVIRWLCDTRGMSAMTAYRYLEAVSARWRKAQESEDLTDRHFQLERMAHQLYAEAMNGIPQHVKNELRNIVDMMQKGYAEEAEARIKQLSNMRIRNLSVAQRVLKTLADMAGIGQKLVLDLSGAGLTLTPQPKALPAAIIDEDE